MRPHHLRLQAFGAFADEVSLDLDALGGQGLVLLSGDTGSGKTTLLDALGFALYGSVVGERSKAKDLRSHHAADGVEPWVELEFTSRGRRMKVRRSPAWRRPGRASELPAKAALFEWRGGVWEGISTRIDEIGLELSTLLGMSAEQFHSVVVLPQGRFATFLQASSAERESLLKKLFLVERFEFVQDWLADRARRAGERLSAAAGVADGLLARVAQVEGTEIPEDAAPGPWAAGVLAAAAATSHRLDASAETASAERATAAATLSAAEDLRRRQQVRGQLDAELAALLADAQRQATRRGVIAAAERARPVLVAAAAEAAARRELDAAVLRCEELDPALRKLDVAATPLATAEEADAVLLDALEGAQQRRGRLSALTGVAEAGAAAAERATIAHRRAVRAEARLEAARQRLASLPGELASAQAEVDKVRAAVAELPELRRAVTEAADAADRRAQRDRDAAEVVEGEVALAEASATVLAVEEAQRELRVRRIDAAATELAAYLEDGTPCPVCGALEHPEPAEVRADDVTREQERELSTALAQARKVHDGLLATVSAARARRDALEALLAGGSAADEGPLRARLEELEEVAEDLASLEHELAELHRADTQARVALATEEAELASARELLAAAQAAADAAAGQLEAETGGATLETVLAATDRLLEVVTTAARASGVLAEARRSHLRAVAALDAVAAEQGFGQAADALAAALPEPDLSHARSAADAFDAAVTALRTRLSDPELAVALSPAADVDEAFAAAEQARKREAAAIAEAALARDKVTQLSALVPELTSAAARVQDLRADASRLRELAEVAAGRGANRLRMPLASYVLAARLEEVADAASLRLERMSAGRYTLVHSDAGRDGRGRAGLALQVEDGWTGRRRDTATLSGGETFQAALALALGLADVVTAEAGGATIDALFVDEGFGSLDPDSLDAVMDVLDSLRSGGRLVGVVSHVTEMRHRIPTRVEVHKGTRGSTLSTTA